MHRLEAVGKEKVHRALYVVIIKWDSPIVLPVHVGLDFQIGQA